MAGKFYAVRTGRTPGIYNSWDDCKAQVDGFPGATYKSFKTAAEAASFMGWGSVEKTVPDTNECGKTAASDSTEYADDMEQKDCVAYVDGSFNVATGEFSYGVVMFHDGEELHFNKRFDDEELASMRNVAGEIKGAEAAMAYALEHGMDKLTIYHDYEGIAKWPLGLWKANKEGTIAYKDFYDKISKNVNIKFVKVKGHSGDKYNDVADRLAKEAVGLA